MGTRPHTGRRRNEAARRAVLDATLRLLREGGADGLTIDAIARSAGVGRQTIYRWWPSRAAIVFEAASEIARDEVPSAPNTGSLAGDLRAFLRATYQGAARPDTIPVLRAMASEALRDEQFAEALRDSPAAAPIKPTRRLTPTPTRSPPCSGGTAARRRATLGEDDNRGRPDDGKAFRSALSNTRAGRRYQLGIAQADSARNGHLGQRPPAARSRRAAEARRIAHLVPQRHFVDAHDHCLHAGDSGIQENQRVGRQPVRACAQRRRPSLVSRSRAACSMRSRSWG